MLCRQRQLRMATLSPATKLPPSQRGCAGSADGVVPSSVIATGNALLPVLNIAGLLLGELIAGALITETVFGRGGLGQLTQQAVNNQDIAVLQAVVMISALGFVLINLLVDLLMPLFDPRLKPLAGGAL